MFDFLIKRNYEKELRRFKLRATPARIAVLKFLEEAKEPVDVGSIIDFLRNKDVDTDPATVFRIMNAFTDKGITNPIQFQEGKTRYELSNKGDHHHLICQNCGRVESITDRVIPQMEQEIGKKHKFLVKRHSLEFFGICRNCQS